MALVLSLRIGQDFYVGDSRVVVSWIDSPFRFGLKVGDEGSKVVTDADWITLMPGVRVMAGIPKSQYQQSIVAVAIDAPGKEVLRGALYHRKKESCETCLGVGELKTKEVCQGCGGFGCKQCGGSGAVLTSFVCPDCGGKYATR